MESILHLKNLLSKEDYSEIINIVDNITSNHNYHLSWKFTGGSTETKSRFWHCRLEKENFFSEYLLQKIIKIIHDNTGEKIVRCSRVYLNGQTYGQQGYMHPDSFYGGNRTFLIYCNDEWKKDWAGGTVFDFGFDSKVFFPFPNSAIYFDSTIFHYAQPVSKDFNDLRVTLAYKLEVETDDE